MCLFSSMWSRWNAFHLNLRHSSRMPRCARNVVYSGYGARRCVPVSCVLYVRTKLYTYWKVDILIESIAKFIENKTRLLKVAATYFQRLNTAILSRSLLFYFRPFLFCSFLIKWIGIDFPLLPPAHTHSLDTKTTFCSNSNDTALHSSATANMRLRSGI